MRLLGDMYHDECAPWCDHDPAHHADNCQSAFCDGHACWQVDHSGCDRCCYLCGKWANECTCNPACLTYFAPNFLDFPLDNYQTSHHQLIY